MREGKKEFDTYPSNSFSDTLMVHRDYNRKMGKDSWIEIHLSYKSQTQTRVTQSVC